MKLKIFLAKIYLQSQRRKIVMRIRKNHKIKGELFKLAREGRGAVKMYLYRPQSIPECQNIPVLFNVHGGAWVMGDALALDTQSQMLSDKLSAFVVNINYKKADEEAFPYAQEEIYDTVRYFCDNAQKYGVDTSRIILMGYSAGAHLCSVAAHMLCDNGVKVASQVLCYPFTDFTCGGGTQKEIQEYLDGIDILDPVIFSKITRDDIRSSPIKNPNLSMLPPTYILTCGEDILRVQGDSYAEALRSAGVDVTLRHLEKSRHGFMETNYPETPEDDSKSPEQERFCRTCLDEIVEYLKKII